MKQIITLSIILVIGMCLQNGYYIESDTNWNDEFLPKAKFFPWDKFNVYYGFDENEHDTQQQSISRD